MSGGVNPLEWILPPLAISHEIVNAVAGAAGGEGITAPGSPTAKRDKAINAANAEAAKTRQLLSTQAKVEHAKLADAQPENIRKRALAAAKALGESGKRPSASAFLSGA